MKVAAELPIGIGILIELERIETEKRKRKIGDNGSIESKACKKQRGEGMKVIIGRKSLFHGITVIWTVNACQLKLVGLWYSKTQQESSSPIE